MKNEEQKNDKKCSSKNSGEFLHAASMLQATLGFSRKMNAFELLNFCFGKSLNEIFRP